MRVLVWQWGRFGAGPRIAVELARGLDRLPGVTALLSLSQRAELMAELPPGGCALPVGTYSGLGGYVGRLATAPFAVASLWAALRRLRPDVAICAMPGPLDLVMQTALRLARITNVVIVHDAEAHPGDGYPLQMWLQGQLIRHSDVVVTLSRYVAGRLKGQALRQPLLIESLPPVEFTAEPPPPGQHGGKLRLLCFGRLLPYKGLDLLAEALVLLGPRDDLEVRIVGRGPESAELDALRVLNGVSVENRWVPEEDIHALIGWSDALVMPYREASQSGVASLAVSARRRVVATDVGGLPEQFGIDNALLCRPEASSIADAIVRLLELKDEGALQAPPPPLDSWTALAGRLVLKLSRNGLPKHAPGKAHTTAGAL